MNFKERLSQIYSRPADRVLLAMIPLLAILVGWQYLASGPKSSADTSSKVESAQADDFIPNGFVLIPVQLENHQSIDSIVGGHAIVNIYKTSESGTAERSQLLGRNLRMVRAPLNPQQFAVLVPENQVDRFVVSQGRLHAVLQNRARGKASEMIAVPARKTIQYY